MKYRLTQALLASTYVILGLILTGVILGNISDAIENMNEETTNFDRKVDEMQIRLKQNKVSENIQEKVMVYMNFCFQEGVEFDEPHNTFDYIAKSLKQKILYQEYEQMLMKVPLFSRLSKNEVYEIFSRFRYAIFSSELGYVCLVIKFLIKEIHAKSSFTSERVE
jgi:hypothetical protein